MNGTLTITKDTTPPTLVVTTATDDNPGVAANCTMQAAAGTGTDASCSLRDALAYAGNAGSANISLDGTVFSASNTVAQNTITLGSAGTLNIPPGTTISGRYTAGSGGRVANLVTVSGAGLYGVFNVATGAAAINGLTIANGNNNSASGGGIDNGGTLTVSNSTISGNSAAQGGGIYSSGTLTVSNSTIAGNSSSSGGGIFSSGTVTTTSSTIAGNSAASAGGGIENSSGLLQLANSIVSGNAATSSVNINGSYTNNGGNELNLSAGAISLAPLGNYGGPMQTMVPLPGSPAICAGTLANASGADLTSDQRGLPFDPNCPAGSVDSGAVQSNYALAFYTQPSDVIVGQVITPPPSVNLTESGMPATVPTNPVTLSDSSVTLNGPTTENLSSGTATFPDLIINTTTLNTHMTATMALTSSVNLTAQAWSALTVLPVPATLTSPAPGSVLTGTEMTFSWSASTGATGYSLWIGTTGVGSYNLYDSGARTVTSLKVAVLPTQGQTIYVRLYTYYHSVAQYNDFTLSASKRAGLNSPTPGSVLAVPVATFTWSAATGATAYSLWLGTTGAGSHNLYSSGSTTGTSATVYVLPTNGKTIYARINTNYNGVPVSNDYTYTAATQAALTNPSPGSGLAGTTVTFKWSAAAGATGYSLWLGSTGPGSYNLYHSGETTATSAMASGLPSNGEIIYGRLYTNYNGVVRYTDYTYIAAP